MTKELEKKVKEILSMVQIVQHKRTAEFDFEDDSLDSTVNEFKKLMDLDTGHEVKADDFLTLCSMAEKKYPGDFRHKMLETLGNDQNYAAEKKVLEVTEQIANITGDDYEPDKIEQACKGFAELVQMQKNSQNFPSNTVTRMMSSILKKYRDTEHKADVAEAVLKEVKGSPFEESLRKFGPSGDLQDQLNQKDYEAEFTQFAKELNDVKRGTDSKEFRAIIAELEAAKNNPPEILGSDGYRSKEYQDLNDNQIKAIPYVRIFSKINQYLVHKAKDGVNRNAYDKLNVVEKLSQYVGKKIHELDPGTFKYPDPKNKSHMISFTADVVRETYAEEYAATEKYIQRGLDNGSLIKTLKIKEEPGTRVDHSAKDFVKDASKNEKVPHSDKDKNIKACLDRITLRAQTRADALKKNIQYGENHLTPLDPVPAHLTKAKKEFMRSLDGPARGM